jgi:hypothetical protein
MLGSDVHHDILTVLGELCREVFAGQQLLPPLREYIRHSQTALSIA